jgi:hypothetical protein
MRIQLELPQERCQVQSIKDLISHKSGFKKKYKTVVSETVLLFFLCLNFIF